MKTRINSLFKVAFCGATALALLQVPVQAQPYNLSDNGSSAVFDPTSVGGMTEWTVGGQDQLTSQAFWVRTGTDTREISLDEIYMSSSGGGNQASATYGVGGIYQIDVSYTLTGLGPYKAQILENITIQNLSGGPLDLSFYQYNNFDLGANGGGDYGRILTNDEGLYSIAQSIEPGVGDILEDAEVQANPGSVLAQVDYFNTILTFLEDANVDSLNNSVGLLGPGNIEFAFQWNYFFEQNGTETISKIKTLDLTVIPEPTAVSLAVLGLGALIGRRLGRRAA